MIVPHLFDCSLDWSLRLIKLKPVLWKWVAVRVHSVPSVCMFLFCSDSVGTGIVSSTCIN